MSKPKFSQRLYVAAAPRNLFLAITKRLRIQGFVVLDYAHRYGQFVVDMEKWIAEGRIKWKETVIDGIENAPKAFIGLFKGVNFGKMLIRLGPESEGGL
jgi:NADPH-dependent curcumin reductase CurA